MTPGSDHIASHRLYPAATNQLELSPPETQHLQDCAFCHGIFQFFHSSKKGQPLGPARPATISGTGIIAQLEERMLHTHEVTGSSPVGPIPNQQLASTFFVAQSGISFWVPRPCASDTRDQKQNPTSSFGSVLMRAEILSRMSANTVSYLRRPRV